MRKFSACLAASVLSLSGQTPPPPTLNPELAEHTAVFHRNVYKIGDNVYSAVGWALANVVMIEGADGIIIVDTSGGIDSGRAIASELRKITQKPVAAVIYTHFHPDHINGVKAFVSPDDVRSGKVPIIAHEDLARDVENQGSVIGPILGVRSAYSFGVGLTAAENRGMNWGIGPAGGSGMATFILPTKTFSDRLDITLARRAHADAPRAQRSPG